CKRELEVLQKQEDQGRIDLYYFDEAGFTLDPYIPYAWQEPGTVIEIPAQKYGRMNVLGFMNRKNDLHPFIFEQSVHTGVVRHPPPSGWLDEPGRLKGGGVPSPYSNSLKPTIIVTGILVTDRRFDLFQLKANRGDRIATRPKVLARESAIMAPKLAGDGHSAFAP